MTQLLDKKQTFKIEDIQVTEDISSKEGRAIVYNQDDDWITVDFKSDEHGNIETLNIVEAVDADELPIDFELTDSVHLSLQNVIEPQLWDDEPYQPRDTARSLGFTNSDFLAV